MCSTYLTTMLSTGGVCCFSVHANVWQYLGFMEQIVYAITSQIWCNVVFLYFGWRFAGNTSLQQFPLYENNCLWFCTGITLALSYLCCLKVLLIYALSEHQQLTYNRTYKYPIWANAVGWMLSLISTGWIPFYALYAFCTSEGETLREVSLFYYRAYAFSTHPDSKRRHVSISLQSMFISAWTNTADFLF